MASIGVSCLYLQTCLPLEIRYRIYEQVLGHDNSLPDPQAIQRHRVANFPSVLIPTKPRKAASHALLNFNRRIHAEVSRYIRSTTMHYLAMASPIRWTFTWRQLIARDTMKRKPILLATSISFRGADAIDLDLQHALYSISCLGSSFTLLHSMRR